jgi:WD40 repeat protein/serine/threonine protein kinase/DNA-binding SARP family transcriptional activator
MPRLEIRLLGPFEATLDGEAASGFDSDKVRALLAYLVSEADRPHRRQSLAGLLWPDWPEREARTNLRSALANLRRVIGDAAAAPSYLTITRQTLQFNLESDTWADVQEYVAQTGELSLDADTVADVEHALDLYRGDFLEGFAVPDSVPFEEWMLLQREHLRRELLSAHQRLATYYEQQAEYDRSLRHAQRQLEVEPWLEEAHRQAMRALALNGQRAAALAQYETAKRALAEELGVEPSAETAALHTRIREGTFEPGVPAKGIRGYELKERIGEGSFGVIYRAHQPVVEREVAIKVIQPELANRPDFVRRFEAEAQLVARLEHPYIVPLYDYWRDPEGAYLVMRWFRAGNLKEALKRGPWKADAVLQLVDQIAGALATAHKQGVVHRDIKPANILLDEQGNAYISDFGIALDPMRADESGGMTGTPAYSSPEQILDEPVSPAADIYSMGVLLHEVLTAEHPFAGDTAEQLLAKQLSEPLPDLTIGRPDLPIELTAVIQTATDKDPERRYPDALALSAALRQAFTSESAVAARVPIYNPYKGLRPFQEADSADFFGRESLVDQLVSRLAEDGPDARFLAVVGPSGSGKSSVVKAGLVPALRRSGLPGSRNWFYVEMFPGNEPLDELAAALLKVAVDPPEGIEERMRSEEGGLLQSIDQVLPPGETELVLVIDQFEELFSPYIDEQVRQQVLDLLIAALADSHSRLRVVVTLRADYYDRPLQYPEFGQLLKSRTEVVLPLTTQELERAIAGPAEHVGVTYEPALIAALVGDVREQPGGLPLMQYTLTELFEARQNGRVSLENYRESGGVLGALAGRAESLYGELTPEQRAVSRTMFLRLVELTETTQERRRRVPRSELILLSDEVGAMGSVIDRFGRYRLLTFDRDPQTREPTVEIAHESLLREWRRLRGWIDDHREDLIVQRRLATAAKEWLDTDRDPGLLATGSRLRQYEDLATETDLVLAPGEREYIDESLGREAMLQAREETLERRALNRLRALVGVLATAALVAGGLTVFAFNQRDIAQEQTFLAEQERSRAEEQADIAQSERTRAEEQSQLAQQQAGLSRARELAAASIANLDKDPQRSILLALEAADVARTADQGVIREIEEALHQAILASRLELIITPEEDERPVSSVAAVFSPDGTQLAVGSSDGIARIYDPVSGEELGLLFGHEDAIIDVKWNSDGSRLLTVSFDGTARMWDVSSGEQLQLYGPIDAPALIGDLSPDDERVVVSSFDNLVRVWDVESAQLLLAVEVPPPLEAIGVAFDPPTGDRIAVAADGPGEFGAGVIIFDAHSGEELLRIPSQDGVCELRWSPDGTRIATASGDTTGRVWDTTTGEELTSFEQHHSFLCTVDFSLDGTMVVTGGDDGAARVWEADTGREVVSLAGHEERVGFAAFSPDGRRVVTSSDDDLIRIWNISPEGRREVLSIHDPTVVLRAQFNPAGTRFATSSFTGTARMWEVATGLPVTTFEGHESWVWTIAISHDGTRVVTGSRDLSARLWDAATGEQLARLDVPVPASGVAFSPDDRYVVIGTFAGTVHLWNLVNGEELPLATFEDELTSIYGVGFSPDGSLVAAGEELTIRLWEVDTATELEPIAISDELFHAAHSMQFTADGIRMLTAHRDGSIRLWDVASRDLLRAYEGHSGLVWDAKLNSDETMIASAGFDGTIRLWDAESGEELLKLEDAQAFTSASFSPDGRGLLVSGDFGARIYVVHEDDLIALAESRLLRWWTPVECFQFLGLEECPPPPAKLDL